MSPTDVNVIVFFAEIAHNKLIQKMKYALDHVGAACRETLSLLLPDPAFVLALYESMNPTLK